MTSQGPRSYRRYRRLLALQPVVLLVYLTVAWADWWLPRHVPAEVFPFFSWDLFSSPRADGRLYTVHITRVASPHSPAAAWQGRTLDNPRHARFLRDSRFQKTARSLAQAYWRKERDAVERLAVQLGNFMRSQGVIEYDLVSLSYHPLRYYKGEEVPDERIVARFAVETGP
jgi:hypothetical protein